jgi:hypothetical protein
MTSFDGCGVFRGAEHKFDANRSWLHVDQNLRLLPHLGTSIQGALNLVDATNPADSGSFLCLDKSQTIMKQRFAKGEDTVTFFGSCLHALLVDLGNFQIQGTLLPLAR